ncbi:hypothetical protein [Cohaesibacter haloalkalitolerans]|uniref:hypothetical protein n=1 Tax=Cohaesibacter haloalkalitolerans TaxID=1162980 RepID=UPI0013C5031C|nr:hypothetical protein [Cohaesibacter haloalkalitolerans]
MAIAIALLVRIKVKRAERLYRSGSFNRVAAIRTMAASHKLFMLSQGVWWGSIFLLLSVVILREFGAMVPVFCLAGGALGVGSAQFASALKARSSLFRLICCKQGAVPVLGRSALVLYALIPDERLAVDRLVDPDGLASLLAVIAHGDGNSNGAALRIPLFGEWPGLSWLRETRLRLRASVPLFGLGCLSGVITGGILLWGVGLDPMMSGATGSWPAFEPRPVVSDGVSSDVASNGKAGFAEKAGDAVAGAGQTGPGHDGGSARTGPEQDRSQGAPGGPDQTASEVSDLLPSGSLPADKEQATAQDKASSFMTSVAQEDAGPDTGETEQTDAEGSELAALGGGRAEAEPQALSDTLAPFPPENRAIYRLEVDLVPGRATGAASSFEGTGRDQREGIASAAGAAETAGSHGRGAKDSRIEEIHAKATNRDTTMPTRPHIPVQQVPRWMKSLIAPPSE